MSAKLEDHYFSDALKWTIVIGSVLISGYLIYAAHHQWIIFFLLMISLISFSRKYVLEVDTDKKQIIDSFYFLWIKIKSEELPFTTLKCIRLHKQRHIYNASTRSSDRQADFNEYIGTLEYDLDKSVELTRNVEYQFIAEEMQSFAGQLNIPIDRTF